MDIYLPQCAFMISNGTGLDAVSGAFRRPICYVNYVPLEYLPDLASAHCHLKHHEKDGKRMTPAEIYAERVNSCAPTNSRKPITLVDNTPAEIKGCGGNGCMH